ncbi:hypothetical protein JHK82_045040 [Glycine max]|nr:hypothetical protein JHK86_045457 [Glycine max]KAG4941369.1 hypothetical protein JHK87_045240 [Glycine soja]KAG4952170.1 hypothetical protein JHK85_046037 [Glycine max]KAG5099988.1 hypothetical protein JHK82_045040 [Glycine max]KAG5108590.1 hypothetical protein JHK84_045497 [Glycine max]
MFLLLHHLQDCGHLIPLTNIYLFILHELGTCTTSFFYLLYAIRSNSMCSFDLILGCYIWIGTILQYP